MTGGELLAQWRFLRRLAQNGLAHAADVDPGYICKLEKDQIEPRRSTLMAVLRPLKLSVEDQDRMLCAFGLAPQINWQDRATKLQECLDNIRHIIGVHGWTDAAYPTTDGAPVDSGRESDRLSESADRVRDGDREDESPGRSSESPADGRGDADPGDRSQLFDRTDPRRVY